jgi:hypothetical protein
VILLRARACSYARRESFGNAKGFLVSRYILNYRYQWMPLRRHRLLKANPLVRPHYLVVAADVEGGGADGSTVVIVAVEQ